MNLASYFLHKGCSLQRIFCWFS